MTVAGSAQKLQCCMFVIATQDAFEDSIILDWVQSLCLEEEEEWMQSIPSSMVIYDGVSSIQTIGVPLDWCSSRLGVSLVFL